MEPQVDHKHPPPQHQVFINFRGDQLRNNFISHLVKALKGHGINVFIDTYEQKGKDVKNLFKRIEESRVALAVFSSRYTESTWCLDELVEIKDRVDLGMLEILPIFYKVPTESVKQLVGKFGDHFRRREWEYRHEQPKIDGWKKALECVTGKLGFTLDDKSSESNFIESVVKEVLRMLASIPLPARTSNPEQIIATSSPVTLTEHAKAEEVNVITTQPKDMLQRPNYVTKRGGGSLAPHTKVSRHGSIPSVLPDNMASYPFLMPFTSSRKHITCEDLSGHSISLLEQNVRAFSQIRANLSSYKVQDNIDLFCQTRNNLRTIQNDMKNMPGLMSRMPPFPVAINDDL